MWRFINLYLHENPEKGVERSEKMHHRIVVASRIPKRELKEDQSSTVSRLYRRGIPKRELKETSYRLQVPLDRQSNPEKGVERVMTPLASHSCNSMNPEKGVERSENDHGGEGRNLRIPKRELKVEG